MRELFSVVWNLGQNLGQFSNRPTPLHGLDIGTGDACQSTKKVYARIGAEVLRESIRAPI